MHYLSIISPFYNSEEKCKRLLNTLLNIKDNEVEIIFVDDGSTDNTLTLLSEFKDNSSIDVSIITQENKGPGGARNAGLKIAQGRYIWFVDSDDDIKVEAIEFLKGVDLNHYDFIDFNYIAKGSISNSMDLIPGSYTDHYKSRELLLDNFGWICTKVFNRKFLIDNAIYYPEYCIYEDGPLMNFIYPLHAKRFLKTDIIAYVHQVDYPSITRSKIKPHDFDRLYTSVYCYKIARDLNIEESVLRKMEEKFVRYYVFGTVSILRSTIPSRKWLLTYRVMKQFRLVSRTLDINLNPINLLENDSKKYQIYFLFHWYVSFLLYKDQTSFFENERLKAWGRPFDTNNVQV